MLLYVHDPNRFLDDLNSLEFAIINGNDKRRNIDREYLIQNVMELIEAMRDHTDPENEEM